MPLTQRQAEAFDFIVGFIREKKYAPSYEEIAVGMGIRSIATVHEHLRLLEQKGMIQRDRACRRSIRVIHSSCPFCFKAGKAENR